MSIITKNIAKIVLGLALALTVVAVSASPASAAGLSAGNIAAIIGLLQSFGADAATIANVQASLSGGTPSAPAASTAMFTTTLQVGSTGAQVMKLQQVLNSNPATQIAATGAGSPGKESTYFGNLTKVALMKYQVWAGVPATGVVDAATLAKLNGVSAVAPVVVTPGVLTPGVLTPGVTTTGTVVADGQDGSVTLSYSPYVTSSQTAKKGDTKDAYAVKLQATSGAVSVNRFDVHFSERPWLIFGQLKLRDSNGTVIATKPLLSAADATEVTVGSDYLVRFDNVNYSVAPGKDATLIVSLTVLAASDKVLAQTVTISIPSGSIRTINGKGYTDSLGLATTNSVTLTSTGSAADIYTRISPNTPVQQQVTNSLTQITPDVVLGVFSLKSQNQNSTINTLSFNINHGTAYSTSTIFSNVRLVDGSTVYGANSLSAAASTFTNLTINLVQDQWKDLILKADVNANTSGTTYATSQGASSTLVAASIVGVDTNFNSLTISNASNATSNDLSFQVSSISVSGLSASFSPTGGGANGNTLGGGVSFAFTIKNTGNSDIFISKVPGVAVATSTTGSAGSPATASSTLTYVVANQDTYASDTGTAPTSGAYVVPAGVSRTFTYTGQVDNTNGTAGLRVYKITQINYGTTAASPTGQNVSYGLSALAVTPNLAAI